MGTLDSDQWIEPIRLAPGEPAAKLVGGQLVGVAGGAFGEQATGKQLKKLEREGWIVLHDLPRGSGNVDHVLVGTGGVFVLDSKRTDGRVVVDEGGVIVTRLDDPDLHFVHSGTPHLLRLARETNERIRARAESTSG
ncbi:MAG: nuclease-related domain-containing protein [Actinomycetota bacterium]